MLTGFDIEALESSDIKALRGGELRGCAPVMRALLSVGDERLNMILCYVYDATVIGLSLAFSKNAESF